jgi:hypothetical protein
LTPLLHVERVALADLAVTTEAIHD